MNRVAKLEIENDIRTWYEKKMVDPNLSVEDRRMLRRLMSYAETGKRFSSQAIEAIQHTVKAREEIIQGRRKNAAYHLNCATNFFINDEIKLK